MTRFNDVTTQFSEYVRRTKGRRMEQVGDTYLPPNLTPGQFYDLMLPLVQGTFEDSRAIMHSPDIVSAPVQITSMGTMWLGMNMEKKWYELGAPEYKIHPGMVEALAHTKLEIPGRAVQLPFPCFAVRLPHHHLRESPKAPWVRSLLVSEVHEQQLGAMRRKLCIMMIFEPNGPCDDPFEYSISSKFELDMHETNALNVSDAVATMPLGQSDDGYWPNREMTTELVALAISTALLAIGADKTLVRRGHISSVERTKRRKVVKKHGPIAAGTSRPYEIGADIKLPRRERNYGSSKSNGESGRHLTYSHVRSGHIRMQRSKRDGEWIWLPKFIKPTLVGKGLPMKPKATPRAIMRPKDEDAA